MQRKRGENVFLESFCINRSLKVKFSILKFMYGIGMKKYPAESLQKAEILEDFLKCITSADTL